jgi:hypothetical protein
MLALLMLQVMYNGSDSEEVIVEKYQREFLKKSLILYQ